MRCEYLSFENFFVQIFSGMEWNVESEKTHGMEWNGNGIQIFKILDHYLKDKLILMENFG